MSMGDQDLYVMKVTEAMGSTLGPGASSRQPILVTFDDLNPSGQVRIAVGSYLALSP